MTLAFACLYIMCLQASEEAEESVIDDDAELVASLARARRLAKKQKKKEKVSVCCTDVVEQQWHGADTLKGHSIGLRTGWERPGRC